MRRIMANYELKCMKEAKNDIEVVLGINPTIKEA